MNSAASTPADVLVIFGITGDLAKKMTFRSLYRLERRHLLDCPIVGVARDDWSSATLRNHARRAIEDTGETIDEEVFGRLPPEYRQNFERNVTEFRQYQPAPNPPPPSPRPAHS